MKWKGQLKGYHEKRRREKMKNEIEKNIYFMKNQKAFCILVEGKEGQKRGDSDVAVGEKLDGGLS